MLGALHDTSHVFILDQVIALMREAEIATYKKESKAQSHLDGTAIVDREEHWWKWSSTTMVVQACAKLAIQLVGRRKSSSLCPFVFFAIFSSVACISLFSFSGGGWCRHESILPPTRSRQPVDAELVRRVSPQRTDAQGASEER